MQSSELFHAVSAAKSIASALGLPADEAIVLHNSNKLALRLLPCSVFARVAPAVQQVAQFEIDLAARLTQSRSPVAALEPRVEPRAYEHGGFVVTLWTYYAPAGRDVAPDSYAAALARLHDGMRQLDTRAPHFTDRVAEAQQIVASPERSPALSDPDRDLLGAALRGFRRTITDRGATEQLLHGEPHPGNLLNTEDGPLFIDFETCCRGPVEFDLAHVPEEAAEHYPSADRELLGDCRGLVLAMVAAWRWDRNDQFPDGRQIGHDFIRILRQGSPWPTLSGMTRRLAGS